MERFLNEENIHKKINNAKALIKKAQELKSNQSEQINQLNPEDLIKQIEEITKLSNEDLIKKINLEENNANNSPNEKVHSSELMEKLPSEDLIKTNIKNNNLSETNENITYLKEDIDPLTKQQMQQQKYQSITNEVKNNYAVTKLDTGKARIETIAMRKLKQESDQMNIKQPLDKQLLIEKQNKTNTDLIDNKLELEIIGKMSLNVDDYLKSSYQSKIKSLQNKIKELELRLSTITNLLTNRI